jgi:hypothetical protein
MPPSERTQVRSDWPWGFGGTGNPASVALPAM